MSNRIRSLVDRIFEADQSSGGLLATYAQEFAKLAGRSKPNAKDMRDAQAHMAEISGRGRSALNQVVSRAMARGEKPIVGRPVGESHFEKVPFEPSFREEGKSEFRRAVEAELRKRGEPVPDVDFSSPEAEEGWGEFIEEVEGQNMSPEEAADTWMAAQDDTMDTYTVSYLGEVPNLVRLLRRSGFDTGFRSAHEDQAGDIARIATNEPVEKAAPQIAKIVQSAGVTIAVEDILAAMQKDLEGMRRRSGDDAGFQQI